MVSLSECGHLVSNLGKLSISVHSHYHCTLRPFIFIKRGGLEGIKAQSSLEDNLTKTRVCFVSPRGGVGRNMQNFTAESAPFQDLLRSALWALCQ